MELEPLVWHTTFFRFLQTGERTYAPASENFETAMQLPFDLLFLWAGIILAFNVGVTKYVARPIGSWLLLNDEQKKTKAKDKTVGKFAGSLMEVVLYAGFGILGFIALRGSAWIWPSSMWWHGSHILTSGKHSQVHELGYESRFFYVVYASRYLQSLFSVVVLENRRADFIVMVIHHIITVAMIYMSLITDWVRVGLVIMVLLDIADPFLHCAKLARYVSKAKGPRAALWGKVTDASFALFALVFTATRIFMYGYICYSASTEPFQFFTKEFTEVDIFCPLRSDCPVASIHFLLWAFLWVLFVLQCIWEVAVLNVIYKALMEGEVEDNRSDDDEKTD